MPSYETKAHRQAEQEVRDFLAQLWSNWTHESKTGAFCPYDGVFHESFATSSTPDVGLRQIVYEIKVRDAPVAKRPITIEYAMREGLLLSEHKWNAVREEAGRRGPTAIPALIVRIEGQLFVSEMYPRILISRRSGQPRKDRQEADDIILLDLASFEQYEM